MKYSHNLPLIFGGALLAIGLPLIGGLNFVMVSPTGEGLLGSGAGSALGLLIGWGYLGGAGILFLTGLLFSAHAFLMNDSLDMPEKVLWSLAMISCLSLVAVPAYWWVYELEPYFTDKMLEDTYSKIERL